eukprot:6396279-Alexandrium_andersonii.AAC.1
MLRQLYGRRVASQRKADHLAGILTVADFKRLARDPTILRRREWSVYFKTHMDDLEYTGPDDG